MVKTISFDEAQAMYELEFSKGKHSKSVSMCDKLRDAYKDFCYIKMKRSDMSSRIRILMVRDMLENP